MDTHVRTPEDIFIRPLHLVVPPFQRPYVWEKDEQWVPLWQDVRRLAELHLSHAPEARHFLGAIVVQATEQSLGGLPASSVIDGQQRLTTLQLLMDATAAVLEAAGYDSFASQLEQLTHNQAIYVEDNETRLKLRHTNRDRAAFDEVMDAPVPVEHTSLQHASARIVRAHEYFMSAVTEWTQSGGAEHAKALTGVLTHGLQLVTINLTVTENSQEIFETLNARGTPLTASDLIKNFVFQRLAAEGIDTREHLDDWPFETSFWEKEVSVGRHLMQRSSLFLNQWLIAQTGEEVSPRATFSRFKQFVDEHEHDSGETLAVLLPLIRQQAEIYEQWTMATDDRARQLTRIEMTAYRMKASGTEALNPLLIWLHDPRRDLPPDVIDQVAAIAESWIVRRQLLRLTIGDVGRIVVDLIRTHGSTPPAELPASVASFISRLDKASIYWPGNAEIRDALRSVPVFRRFKKSRTRMLLEAIEDSLRAETGQPQVTRDKFPIEHVLPQKWADNWPVDGIEAEELRDEHVHRLGNLTLLTTSLNSKVSNGPWSAKSEALKRYDTMLLNSRLLATAGDVWDEDGIDSRTDALVDRLFSIWPVPEGHVGEVVDPHEKAGGWIELRHLLEAGLIAPGAALTSRVGEWESVSATVCADGQLEVGGRKFDSPSGAGKFVKGGATNGWTFWTLADGRKLRDLRDAYSGVDPRRDAKRFDWSTLHTILEALPEGHWTSYGSLADAVGTSPQPLAAHLVSCTQCANAHRVLRSGGVVAPGFKWTSPDDQRDPVELLHAEGAFVGGKASPGRELSSDDLQALIEE